VACVYFFSGIVTGYDDDIESAEDLYDAIGSMLEGLDSNLEDDTVREICQRLHDTRLKYVIIVIICVCFDMTIARQYSTLKNEKKYNIIHSSTNQYSI